MATSTLWLNTFIGSTSDDGTSPAQSGNSLQIEQGSSFKLTWTTTSADSVVLNDPEKGPTTLGANDSIELTPAGAELDYSMIAIGGGIQTLPLTVHVSTHPEGEVISSHASVQAPDVAIAWSFVKPDGTPLADQKCTVTTEDGTELTGQLVGGVLNMQVPAGQLTIEVEGHIIGQINIPAAA